MELLTELAEEGVLARYAVVTAVPAVMSAASPTTDYEARAAFDPFRTRPAFLATLTSSALPP
ncbi:MAG: hypothetical protein H0T95_01030 [Chthoniobacterales bacterium]|nr:hypothetical protein [Chthoniobacterales bacterium]MBA3762006.1 hypothetical protein [Chthoniobacterales bacterium]